MSDRKGSYRDELAAAHRRIAQLEEENALLEERLAIALDERDAKENKVPPDEVVEELRRQKRHLEWERDAGRGYGPGLLPLLAVMIIALVAGGTAIVERFGAMSIPLWVAFGVLLLRFVATTIRRGHQRTMKRRIAAITSRIAAERARAKLRVALQEDIAAHEHEDEPAAGEADETEERGARLRR